MQNGMKRDGRDVREIWTFGCDSRKSFSRVAHLSSLGHPAAKPNVPATRSRLSQSLLSEAQGKVQRLSEAQ
jgi:hypothetical protein